jgi:hypothetical protein
MSSKCPRIALEFGVTHHASGETTWGMDPPREVLCEGVENLDFQIRDIRQGVVLQR